MTINELDQFLEHAVSNWFNTMNNATDPLLNYDDRGKLEAPYYNFSSASGMHYKIDVTRQPGSRVTITKINNHNRFNYSDTVRVALNSYRLVGGGGHMPKGAGIDLEELKQRNVILSDVPIKNIMMKFFSQQDSVWIQYDKNWEVIPEKWTKPAQQKEIRNF